MPESIITEKSKSGYFDHEKWDVYLVALEFIIDEKARFYRMAKRSATECSSILDVCEQLQLIDEVQHSRGRELLLRIAVMLTKMARASVR